MPVTLTVFCQSAIFMPRFRGKLSKMLLQQAEIPAKRRGAAVRLQLRKPCNNADALEKRAVV